MSKISTITAVDPILFGVVKVAWDDGFEAVVDLRPVIAEGELFAFLRNDADRFRSVQREQYGHYIFWIDDDGDEVEFGSDSLRRRAIRQAEILRLAS